MMAGGAITRRTITVVTPPASTPVSLGDCKDMLNVSDTTDDNLISGFIEAATDDVRRYLGRSIVTETLDLTIDAFPGYDDDALARLGPGMHVGSYPWLVSGGTDIDLPYGPVASVASITTYNKLNAATVLSSDYWRLSQNRVVLNDGATWPVDLRRRDGVVVRYVSGQAVADVPPGIKHGIKVYVAAMFECREGCSMPPACMAILHQYRRLDALGWL